MVGFISIVEEERETSSKQLPKKVKIASAPWLDRRVCRKSNGNLERHFVVVGHSHQFRKWELARVAPITETGLLLPQ